MKNKMKKSKKYIGARSSFKVLGRVLDKHDPRNQNQIDWRTDPKGHRQETLLIILQAFITFFNVPTSASVFKYIQDIQDKIIVEPGTFGSLVAGDGWITCQKIETQYRTVSREVRTCTSFQSSVGACNTNLINMLTAYKAVGYTFEEGLLKTYINKQLHAKNACYCYHFKVSHKDEVARILKENQGTFASKNEIANRILEGITHYWGDLEYWEVLNEWRKQFNARGQDPRIPGYLSDAKFR